MPEKKQVNRGKELLGWEVAEYHEHARGKLWFVVAALIGLALIFYSLQERNFLFAFIVIMVAVILITHSIRPSARYYFGAYELGAGLGGRFYQCEWSNKTYESLGKGFVNAFLPVERAKLFLDSI